jgi:hypothetical protein
VTPEERRDAQRRVVFLAADARNLLWDPTAAPKPARRPARTGEAAIARELLPPTRKATREDHAVAQLHARQWSDAGFPAAEVRAWLAAGVHPDESQVAVDCRVESITT